LHPAQTDHKNLAKHNRTDFKCQQNFEIFFLISTPYCSLDFFLIINDNERKTIRK
jgi:hypothetical protein